jgi:hypothetical protein
MTSSESASSGRNWNHPRFYSGILCIRFFNGSQQDALIALWKCMLVVVHLAIAVTDETKTHPMLPGYARILVLPKRGSRPGIPASVGPLANISRRVRAVWVITSWNAQLLLWVPI